MSPESPHHKTPVEILLHSESLCSDTVCILMGIQVFFFTFFERDGLRIILLNWKASVVFSCHADFVLLQRKLHE
uniref:Uncharacterized protein MANES_13G068200 n=1 Tax=Rhizophora mucronata TaxID=61149 RepID=A0A2P2K8V3_RHIMU